MYYSVSSLLTRVTFIKILFLKPAEVRASKFDSSHI